VNVTIFQDSLLRNDLNPKVELQILLFAVKLEKSFNIDNINLE